MDPFTIGACAVTVGSFILGRVYESYMSPTTSTSNTINNNTTESLLTSPSGNVYSSLAPPFVIEIPLQTLYVNKKIKCVDQLTRNLEQKLVLRDTTIPSSKLKWTKEETQYLQHLNLIKDIEKGKEDKVKLRTITDSLEKKKKEKEEPKEIEFLVARSKLKPVSSSSSSVYKKKSQEDLNFL